MKKIELLWLVMILIGLVMIWRWWDKSMLMLIIAGVSIGVASVMLVVMALGQ